LRVKEEKNLSRGVAMPRLFPHNQRGIMEEERTSTWREKKKNVVRRRVMQLLKRGTQREKRPALGLM